jgi:hypothetical protein
LIKHFSSLSKKIVFFFVDKSSLVNYERDSDDDEHTDEEEEDENNEEQLGEDDQSNSNSAGILHGAGEVDIQIETTTVTEQTIVTSDLLNVTPVFTFNHDFYLNFVFFVYSLNQKKHHPHLVAI